MYELEVETMENMAKRLRGTGGGDQAKAVMKAIKAINSAPGMLDAKNRTAALYHLSRAISGPDRAVDTILNAAEVLGGQGWSK